MKNKIKILSILVLLIFTVSYALPLFAQENCDMPKSNDSAFHCDMAEMGCCEMVTECVVVPFYPITSAPLNKIEIQKDITVDYDILYSDNIIFFENYSFYQVEDDHYLFEHYPGFQTPLLV